MMWKTRGIAALFCLLPHVAEADWEVAVAALGGSDVDIGDATAIDDQGNIYVSGQFQGTITLGDETYTSLGGTDVFVAKFDPDGSVRWSLAGGGSESEYIGDIAVDSRGHVVIVGSTSSPSPSFGGGALPTAGTLDVFVASYNPVGIHEWSATYGGPTTDRGQAIDVDSNDNVIFGGAFSLDADFGVGTLTSNGFNDAFVVTTDPSGTPTGLRGWGGAQADEVYGVAFDENDDFVITGVFGETVDFGLGSLTSAGEADIFLCKYAAETADPLWTQRFGGAGIDVGAGVVTGTLASVFVTGSFSEVVNFGGGGLGSAGFSDGFVAGYSSSGAHVWSRRFGGPLPDRALAIDVAGDRVAIAGDFRDVIDVGADVWTSAGDEDAIVVEYGPLGAYRGSAVGGGLQYDSGADVSVAANVLVVGGTFYGPALFGDEALSGNGGYDMFIARYRDPAVSVGESGTVGAAFHLSPATPNPSRAGVRFTYTWVGDAPSTFEVFDAGGRLVHRSVPTAGDVDWDGLDAAGRSVAAGVYFARLRRGAEAITRRVTIAR